MAESTTATPEETASMGDIATLRVNGDELEMPVVVGSENEVGIDIGKLRGKTGAITLDPGYVNTGSTESAITYLDGESGILRYRGYPIEVLARECSFVEVSYLLMYGELPTSDQFEEFRNSLRQHSMLHEDIRSSTADFHVTHTPWRFVVRSSPHYQRSTKILSTLTTRDRLRSARID